MKKMMGRGVVAAALMMSGSMMAAEPNLADVLARTKPLTWIAPEGGVFRYRWHEPLTQQAKQSCPLVIFMHGAGERGTNNVSQLKWGVREMFDCLQARGEEFFFVAGQVPGGKRWVEVDWSMLAHAMPENPSETMALQMAFVDYLFATRPEIDRSRVYVTGVSMGGYGTWDILCRRPMWFAAAMPICGGADVSQVWRLREIPIWTFHGDCDSTVPVSRSRTVVAALWACDGNVKYTEYPDVGHGSWIPAYGDRKNLDWMFLQRKQISK